MTASDDFIDFDENEEPEDNPEELEKALIKIKSRCEKANIEFEEIKDPVLKKRIIGKLNFLQVVKKDLSHYLTLKILINF